MHPRFAGAATTKLECPGGAIEVVLAESFRLRLIGLMRLGADEVEPLLFPRCRSIHTFGMKTPIDLVWLELAGARAGVVGLSPGLKPGRIELAPRVTTRPRALGALELRPEHAASLGLEPEVDLSLSYRLGAQVAQAR